MERAVQLTLVLLSLLSAVDMSAQDEVASLEPQDQESDMFELSLEELMSIEIFSASRQEESSFDVPLSSFVVTRREIELLGATSIPDALRIVPGVIVREVANGSYDVSLRGGVDGLPSYDFTYVNSSILVMIDNRPVFSYFQGGTFWQNLPVGMAEVDRIEVVHGPVSTLYGPNAVSGVINILTNRPNKERNVYGNATGFAGTHAYMGSAVAGANIGNDWAVELAFNYERRKKLEETLYEPDLEEYVPVRDLDLGTLERNIERYPDPEESLDKLGATFNVYYQNDNIDLKVGGSYNNANALYPLAAGAGLTVFTNDSRNVLLSGNVFGFTVMASYLTGTQGLSGDVTPNHYDYSNTDLYLDYVLTVNDKISVRPAVSYQSAFLDDTQYTVDRGEVGNFNGEGTLTNFAPSVKVDLTPWEQWRFILGGRYDIFNYPEDGVFSYQGIVNYKPAERHLLRFVTGKSYNSSFLVPTLVSIQNQLNASIRLNLEGNQNLDLVSNTLYEVGYRAKFANNSVLDIALFQQQFENFNTSIAQLPFFNPATGVLNLNFEQGNLPLTAQQRGATISFQATLFDSKLQVRPNVTFQQTKLYDYSPYYNVEGAYDNPQFNFVLGEHIDNVEDVDSEYTPDVFGGMNVIFNPIEKLNLNVSMYYFSAYAMDMNTELDFRTGQINNQAGRNIDGKLLLNANINYAVNKNFSLFVYGSNLLNNDSPEGFGADKLGFQAMGGLRYRL